MDIIDKLKHLDELCQKYGDIEKIDSFIKTILLSIPVTTATANYGAYFFRAVKEREKELCEKKEISYCQKEYLNHIKLGRANFPNQAIFYGANNELIALKETSELWRNKSLKKGTEYIYVGRWKVEKPFDVVEVVHSKKFGKVNFLLNSKRNYHNDIIQKLEKNNSELIYFLDYISDKFSLENDLTNTNYLITSVFSNICYNGIKYSRKGIDTLGVFYPSIINPLEMNIALIPKIIDEDFITLQEVVKYKVELNDNCWSYKLISKTKSSGEIIDTFILTNINN